ncbi:MAG: hypothetical protein IJH34_08140, partial [Romboutsia sp.]|nr:hypothetical protein [Romboutsia sp.]
IDGREVGGNKNYYIYNNLDEALVDLESTCIDIIESLDDDSTNNLKYELSMINDIKKTYPKNKFSYSLKLNLLLKLSNLFSKDFFDFEFKETDIIVNTEGRDYIYEDIDDILLKYQNIIKQYFLDEYKLVYDLILSKSYYIINEFIDNTKYILVKCSPYTMNIVNSANRKIKAKKTLLELCEEVIEIIEKEPHIIDYTNRSGMKLDNYQKTIAYKIEEEYELKKNYLNTCKSIISREFNIRYVKDYFVSCDENKIKLAKDAIEIIKSEHCFEKTKWDNINTQLYIKIADDIIDNDEMFTEIVDYLLERLDNEDVDAIHYLNSSYDFIKSIVEEIISDFQFYNSENEMYDEYKNINSIMNILVKNKIPSDIIFANEDAIYITLNKDNSDYIVIKDNAVINYKNKIYKFTFLDSFIDFIESNINEYDKHKIDCDNYKESTLANSYKDNNFITRVYIKEIFEISHVGKFEQYYDFKMYFSFDILDEVNSRLNNNLDIKPFINCKVYYKDGIFDFDNIYISIIWGKNHSYDYKFTIKEINKIKNHITKYIIENKLGNMNDTNEYEEENIE